MRIDPVHREITQVYPNEVYHQLAQGYVNALRTIDYVSSIVICGSTVKTDLVSGWSDIDVIVFVSYSLDRLDTINNIRQTLIDAQGDIQIGLGLDIVYDDEFAITNKLCGRPLAMSYEVAAYGEIRHGVNPFTPLRPIHTVYEQIAVERSIAIASEVHSWRRAFMTYNPLSNDDEFIKWGARCVKSTLKLLKYETDPNTTPPFTYEGSLERLLVSNPSHPALGAFITSVHLRKCWLSCIADLIAMREAINTICVALAKYPIV